MRIALLLAAALSMGCEGTEVESDSGGLSWREFPPGFAAFDEGEAFPATQCNFAVNPACNLYAHPSTNCKERENPDGAGVVQDIKNMHCNATPLCAGGAGDIDVIRVCVPGGGGQQTACGVTGPAGCAVCTASAECY